MIGVVIWSDQADRKAVFWCEDQGDLAYFEQTGAAGANETFFDAGDMVSFEIHVDGKLRKARNAVLVGGRACSGLAEKLRDYPACQPIAACAPSDNVIPLRTARPPTAERLRREA